MIKLSHLLLLIAVSLLVAPVASAWHSNDPAVESKSCSGPHCTIVGFWQAWAGDRPPTGGNALLASNVGKITLHGTASLFTSISAPATGIVANCEAGETIEVPIQASGEIVGAGKAFWDSPPIQFHPRGLVRAITDGIPFSCELGPDGEGNARCAREFNKPIEGVWQDTWTTSGVTSGSVTCSTNEDGKTATCVVARGTTGTPSITLSRSVSNMLWQIGEAQYRTQPTVLPATLTSSAPLACRAATVPNLTIEAVSIFPNNPDNSEPIDVNAVVANTGTQNTPATVSRIRFDEGADGSWNVGPLDAQTPAIVRNQSEVVRWVNIWQPPAGTHRLEVCADATNTVPEANEADNCKVLVFVVRPAVLTCSPATQTVVANTPVFAGSVAQFETNGSYAATWSAPGAEIKTAVGKMFSTKFPSFPSSTTVTVKEGAQTATCTVNVIIGDPTPTPSYSPTSVAPYADLECGPQKQTQRVGTDAHFRVTRGYAAAWLAPGGTPAAGPSTPTFTTRYTAPGNYQVSFVPIYFYDVTGDDYIDQEDFNAVNAHIGGSAAGSGARWQNQANRYDVNGDGKVVPLDSLAISNYLNERGAGKAPIPQCSIEIVPAQITPTPTTTPTATPTATPTSSGGPFNPGPIRETE